MATGVDLAVDSSAMTRVASAFALGAAMICGAVISADSFNLTAKWKAPGEGPHSFAGQRVVALVITSDFDLQMSAEEALAREITARGAQGVAAYRIIPREELKDKDKAKAWFERSKAAGVVALRLVGQEQRTTYSSVVWSSGYYGNFYDYYGYGWGTVTPIGKGKLETLVAVETLLYRMSDAKLLWAGVCETTNPNDAGAFMKGLTKEVVKELEKDGLVRKR
jgi:hypothetical protein